MAIPEPGYMGAFLARWLRCNIGPGGRVRDPVHGECGTYADGFAALGFGLAGEFPGEGGWDEACAASCRIALARPADSEFDQLALLLLAAVAPEGLKLPYRVEDVRLYRGGRLVSNNWVAMRALNFSLRALLTESKEDAVEATRLWERVLRWQLPDGLFNDSPVGLATPVTYHAKFCAMLALALRLTPDHCPQTRLREALRHGLSALHPLVSPGGVLAPYGRSRNTLFGYAAAVLAFYCGGILFEQQEYVARALSLLLHMELAIRNEHIPCVLNDGEADKRDWDVYVNNPDYNAYAAGMLLVTHRLCGLIQKQNWSWPRCETLETHRVGPLVVVRKELLYGVLSAEGQSAPYGTPFFCDYRYYGMQPLYVEDHRRALFEAAPYEWSRETIVDPACARWLPYRDVDGDRHTVRVYDEVEVSTEGERVVVTGRGVPEAYAPISRLERGLRGLGGKAAPQFRSRRLKGTVLTRTLSLETGSGAIAATAQLDPPHPGLVPGEQNWRPD